MINTGTTQKLGLEKRKRTHDPHYLAEIRKCPCLACGKEAPSEAHHIRSRGNGGGDDWFNIMPLCRMCHTQGQNAWHRGKRNFFLAYPHVKEYLKKLGWKFIGKARLAHVSSIG